MKAKLIVEGKEFDIEISEDELKKFRSRQNTGYERSVKNGSYFYVDSYDDIGIRDEVEDTVDQNRYEVANYYKNYGVAENNARADKLMRQLRRYAVFHRNEKVDWYDISQKKYYICYDYTSDVLHICSNSVNRSMFDVYYLSASDAQAVIDIFHDELIWYFTEYKDSL